MSFGADFPGSMANRLDGTTQQIALPDLGDPKLYLPQTSLLPPISAEIAALNIPPAPTDHFSPPVKEAIKRQAEAFGVNEEALARLIQIESSGNPYASTGTHDGLMQLSGDIQRQYGVTNPFDPDQNIRGGLNYLKNSVAPELMEQTGLALNELTVAHFYICHQQGAYGGPAIIKAAMNENDNRPAWQVLRDDVGLPEAQAKDHIYGNIPASYTGDRSTMTARAFFDIYRAKIGEPYASQPLFEPQQPRLPVATMRAN